MTLDTKESHAQRVAENEARRASDRETLRRDAPTGHHGSSYQRIASSWPAKIAPIPRRSAPVRFGRSRTTSR
jgi:hypothetical protein